MYYNKFNKSDSNSDNPDENNPPLRKSLMKNIEEIK